MAAVYEYLQGRGAAFQVIPHPPAATSAEEARALGVPEGELVRTLAVVAAFGTALVIIPASRRLDLKLVRAAIGDPNARPATEDELERMFPDYEPGALPPLGMFFQTPMYVDPAVVRHESVVFAGGRRTVSIRMTTRDLFRGDPIVIVPLTEGSALGAER